MAIIYNKKINDTRYQIRKAGDSIRLYTDGVLHTQYHQKKHITGSVWDLLFLPSLLIKSDKPLKILVLGVGGGAILKMFQHFLECEKITGIELNPQHIKLAQDFFKVKNIKSEQGAEFELIEADAIEWVQKQSIIEDLLSNNRANKRTGKKSQQYDLIIDDLFYEEDGEPIKLVPPTASWFYHLSSMLSPQGVLVMNHVGRKSALSSAILENVEFAPQDLVNRFPHVLHFTTPFYDNHVLAMSKQSLSAKELKQQIEQHPELSKLKKELRYKVQKIQG